MEKVSNKKNDLVSVVVPVYKVEEYLDRCVKSIINQSYKNIEIILVDDGSPDNCGEMCEGYAKEDNRIKVIHKKNGGLSDARNKGIEVASGKYITFIDSDDYIEKDYVKLLYKTIQQDKTDMVIGSHKVIYDNGTILEKETKEKSVLLPREVLERILYDEGIDLSAWAKLYKIELFKETRYPKGRVFEDAATTYKLVDASKKISINSKSIYNYMIRNNSITNDKFSESKFDLLISTEEMSSYVSSKYPELKRAADRRLMYAYLSTLSQLAKTKNPKKEYVDRLMSYINKNRFKILKDKRVPSRDKIAIISTFFGFKIYSFSWNVYRKVTGRI